MQKRIQILIKLFSVFLFFSFAFELFAQNLKSQNKIEKEEKYIYDKNYEIENNSSIPLLPFDSIPDSSSLRKLIGGMWFSDLPFKLENQENNIHTDTDGKNFKVQVVNLEEKKRTAVIISPVNTDFSSSGKNNIPQGTWILFKDSESGLPLEIKIYPRENKELYLRLYPDKNHENSFLDICLFNAYIRKAQPLAVSFRALYYLSLKDLRDLTEDTIPWKIFDPPIFYGAVESASDIIDERLHQLVYLEDAGFNEYGEPIHLKDGSPQTKEEIITALKENQNFKEVIGGVNCSGFAKWIIDGIIRPSTGQGIFLKPLKTQTENTETHFNRPYTESRDLFFGLDWIRNLAAAVLSLNLKRTVKPLGSGVDVKEEPFALVPPVYKSSNNPYPAPFKGYSLNSGYQTEYLQALLYYLAITEPGHFYLGAVNRDIGAPPLRQYHHIAAFFPYFDSLGGFHIDVYESGKKTSISLFTKRNADAFIALTRIRAPEIGLFNP